MWWCTQLTRFQTHTQLTEQDCFVVDILKLITFSNRTQQCLTCPVVKQAWFLQGTGQCQRNADSGACIAPSHGDSACVLSTCVGHSAQGPTWPEVYSASTPLQHLHRHLQSANLALMWWKVWNSNTNTSNTNIVLLTHSNRHAFQSDSRSWYSWIGSAVLSFSFSF